MSKVLIIDDDNFICEILKKHLQNHKYDVQIAYTGKSAEQTIKKSNFDLILCDFRLPDTSGLELLQKIRAIKQEIPVVIMTAYADVRMAVKLMKMGASDYITKPIQQEELLSLIKKLVKKEKQPKPQPTHSTYINGDFIIGDSEKIKLVIKLARRVAPTNMSVIIGGETGIGKEYIARFIHENSLRKDKPFVAIDCGAIPKDLANSVLFGHVKGSFTGAISDKDGMFQKAHGGTLFLDEIGNLSYDIQLKLLRAIQERVVSRLGDDKLFQNDIRIIAASNDNLLSEVHNNTFREDLYHRLNEFKIEIPPLRERPEDIEVFVKHFISMANNELNREVKGVTPDAKKIIMEYSWYGNLRELKNVIKRAVLMADGEMLDQFCFPEEITFPQNYDRPNGAETIEVKASDSKLKNASYEIEKQLIIKTIREAGFNKSKAARILNIDRKTLYNKLKLYDIKL
ncbi:sigma-54-dependent transcriptional regulator [Maribellus maritimus]|uniref:sigma-54-dependent transcriptional regulator n=1 Tax=Maribellus maritimus TaxID=2870838 RepID=UPI001EEBDC02|nr:sigma-54 dependent transcriptional regulator [Maribellus maritimus]MCG6188354.1 sigma-54 dependent transcriptional regulator [Maribellus maritimus]